MATSMGTKQVRTTDLVRSSDQTINEIVRAALGGHEITVDIPKDATLVQIEEILSWAITGYRRLTTGSERIKPLIGRILLTVEQRKSFRPNYTNFTEYLEKKVVNEFGYSRSASFEALRIARNFSGLTIAEYQNYGATRLLEASKITDESDPQHKEILAAATRMTTEQFREYVKAKKASNMGSSLPEPSVVVAIRCSEDVRKMWNELQAEHPDTEAGELFKQSLMAFRGTPAKRRPGRPKAA